MERTLQHFVGLVPLTKRVHYVSGDSRHDRAEDCVTLHVDRFRECPDIATFVAAIEKKLSRSNSYSRSSTVVPLCILLLCSEGYCINSHSAEDVTDSIIEYCWECTESISATVNFELQGWVMRCSGGRSCLEYSRIYSRRGLTSSRVSSSATLLHVGESRFEKVSMRDLGIPDSCTTFEEAALQTMLAHIVSVESRKHT